MTGDLKNLPQSELNKSEQASKNTLVRQSYMRWMMPNRNLSKLKC